jgi:hypothetical protein
MKFQKSKGKVEMNPASAKSRGFSRRDNKQRKSELNLNVIKPGKSRQAKRHKPDTIRRERRICKHVVKYVKCKHVAKWRKEPKKQGEQAGKEMNPASAKSKICRNEPKPRKRKIK